MRKPLSITLALLLLTGLANSAMAETATAKNWMIGTEFDFVPYLFDGYYSSVVAGKGNWRARFVLTDITTPGFATQKGFKDNRMYVNAYIADYYFKPGFKGWWVGPGFETWKGKVRAESGGPRRHYYTDIVTLGGGYTFRINDHLYINPWAAVHFPVGGDTRVKFPGSTYRLSPTPEASVKIGLNF